jgi:hypothetical protein
MRKIVNSLIAILFFMVPLISQAQTSITGRVLNDAGVAVEGASVTIKGKAVGTNTDRQGNFKINAAKGDVILISYIGFATQQVTVKDATSVTVKLVALDKTMEEVVVAMDIKRNPRELGYSVQTVKGSDVAETQRENFVNGLQGLV